MGGYDRYDDCDYYSFAFSSVSDRDAHEYIKGHRHG